MPRPDCTSISAASLHRGHSCTHTILLISVLFVASRVCVSLTVLCVDVLVILATCSGSTSVRALH